MDKEYALNSESLAGKPMHVRLLYMLGVGVLGYLTFMALLVLGVVQAIYVAVNKSRNEELAHFNSELLSYLTEVLAFIGFLNDSPPFPFAPFPDSGRTPS